MDAQRKKELAQARTDFQPAAKMLDQRIRAALEKLRQDQVWAGDFRVKRSLCAVPDRDSIAAEFHGYRGVVVGSG
jgi:hypothetical protein